MIFSITRISNTKSTGRPNRKDGQSLEEIVSVHHPGIVCLTLARSGKTPVLAGMIVCGPRIISDAGAMPLSSGAGRHRSCGLAFSVDGLVGLRIQRVLLRRSSFPWGVKKTQRTASAPIETVSSERCSRTTGELQAPNTVQNGDARRKKEPVESTACIFWSHRQVAGSSPALGSSFFWVPIFQSVYAPIFCTR